MKKFFKILFGFLVAVVFLTVIAVTLLVYASKQPVVKSDYYEKVSSAAPLEKKYILKGEYEVSYAEYILDDEKIEKYKIWYPKAINDRNEKYPLVIMANGTGVPASRYEAIFDHLASWGFIVVGNEDSDSWDGVSSAKSLDFALSLNEDTSSVFYGKIDGCDIGIAGHSQGGVGAINAVTAQANGDKYTSIYTASTTWIDLAAALKWNYDIKNISIPYFFVAGTGKVDDETISPLDAMEKTFDEIESGRLTVMARRKNTDHGEMLANADGYMVAWFAYTLKDDKEAEKIFIGDNAEIKFNSNWQDVKIK